MSSPKIFLLIGLLTGSAAILWISLYPPPIQTPPEVSLQSLNQRNAAVDSRFERTEFDYKLQIEADALLFLFDQMPPVPVYVKDEPILKTGTNTETANAYTHCDKHEFPFILIKKIYYQNANRDRLVKTLKHELTHAWLCRQNLMSAGHGGVFRQKFKQVGGWGILSDKTK